MASDWLGRAPNSTESIFIQLAQVLAKLHPNTGRPWLPLPKLAVCNLPNEISGKGEGALLCSDTAAASTGEKSRCAPGECPHLLTGRREWPPGFFPPKLYLTRLGTGLEGVRELDSMLVCAGAAVWGGGLQA